jgi:hypothetical protein
MYKIEKKGFGYKLTFSGSIRSEEMAQWFQDFGEVLESQSGTFFVFVDMRALIPLSREAQTFMQEGQVLALKKGMLRSVVITKSPVTEAQFRRIGGETGIIQGERYVDATATPDWEKVGLDWLLKAIEPGQRRVIVA